MALMVTNSVGGQDLPNTKVATKNIEALNAYKATFITGSIGQSRDSTTYSTEITDGPSSYSTCAPDQFRVYKLSENTVIVRFYAGASNGTMMFAVYDITTDKFSNLLAYSGQYNPCILRKNDTEFYVAYGYTNGRGVYKCTYNPSTNTASTVNYQKYSSATSYCIYTMKHNGDDYFAFGGSWSSLDFYNMNRTDGDITGDPDFTINKNSMNNYFNTSSIDGSTYPVLFDSETETYIAGRSSYSGNVVTITYCAFKIENNDIAIVDTWSYNNVFDERESLSDVCYLTTLNGFSMIDDDRFLQVLSVNRSYSDCYIHYLLFKKTNGKPILQNYTKNTVARGYTGSYTGGSATGISGVLLSANHIILPITDGLFKGMSSGNYQLGSYKRYGEAYIHEDGRISRLVGIPFIPSNSLSTIYMLSATKLNNGDTLIFFTTETTYKVYSSSVSVFAVLLKANDSGLHSGLTDHRYVSPYSKLVYQYYTFEHILGLPMKDSSADDTAEMYII